MSGPNVWPCPAKTHQSASSNIKPRLLHLKFCWRRREVFFRWLYNIRIQKDVVCIAKWGPPFLPIFYVVVVAYFGIKSSGRFTSPAGDGSRGRLLFFQKVKSHNNCWVSFQFPSEVERCNELASSNGKNNSIVRVIIFCLLNPIAFRCTCIANCYNMVRHCNTASDNQRP